MKNMIKDVMTIYHMGKMIYPYWTEESLKEWKIGQHRLIESITDETTLREFYLLLMTWCSELNDGHTLIYLPDTLKNEERYASAPLIKKNKQIYVGGDYLEYGPIRQINGMSSDDLIDIVVHHYWPHQFSVSFAYFQNNASFFLPGKGWSIIFETGQKLFFPYERTPLELNETVSNSLYSDKHLTIYGEQAKIIVQIKDFMSPSVVTNFYAFLPELQACEEIIFDVRDNMGGNSGFANAIAQAFFTESFETEKVARQVLDASYYASGTMMFAGDFVDQEDLDEESKKIYETYHHLFLEEMIETDYYPERVGLLKDKPVKLLQNNHTYSSAENFVMIFSNSQRGQVIGEASAGSTGQPALIPLETGGTFMVTAKKVALPNGKEHHNIGVIPDVCLTQPETSKEDVVLKYAITH